MKTLIFDFDGTIADSFETFLAIFEDITNRKQRLTASEIDDLRGKSLKQIFKYLDVKTWQLPRMAVKARRELKLRMTDIMIFKDLAEVIKQLHKDGYQMLIVSTNDPHTIAKFLKTNDIYSCFSHIYGNIGVFGKANALRRAIKAQKLSKADCIYIGDEVRDVEAAKKVGIKPVSVGWGFNYPPALRKAGPAALAEQPKDLLDILSTDK